MWMIFKIDFQTVVTFVERSAGVTLKPKQLLSFAVFRKLHTTCEGCFSSNLASRCIRYSKPASCMSSFLKSTPGPSTLLLRCFFPVAIPAPCTQNDIQMLQTNTSLKHSYCMHGAFPFKINRSLEKNYCSPVSKHGLPGPPVSQPTGLPQHGVYCKMHPLTKYTPPLHLLQVFHWLGPALWATGPAWHRLNAYKKMGHWSSASSFHHLINPTTSIPVSNFQHSKCNFLIMKSNLKLCSFSCTT